MIYNQFLIKQLSTQQLSSKLLDKRSYLCILASSLRNFYSMDTQHNSLGCFSVMEVGNRNRKSKMTVAWLVLLPLVLVRNRALRSHVVWYWCKQGASDVNGTLTEILKLILLINFKIFKSYIFKSWNMLVYFVVTFTINFFFWISLQSLRIKISSYFTIISVLDTSWNSSQEISESQKPVRHLVA